MTRPDAILLACTHYDPAAWHRRLVLPILGGQTVACCRACWDAAHERRAGDARRGAPRPTTDTDSAQTPPEIAPPARCGACGGALVTFCPACRGRKGGQSPSPAKAAAAKRNAVTARDAKAAAAVRQRRMDAWGEDAP